MTNNISKFPRNKSLIAIIVCMSISFHLSCSQTITDPVESNLKKPLLVYEFWDYYQATDDYTQGNFIMLMMNDGEIRLISDSAGYSMNPKISPTGKEIMYSSNSALIKYNLERNLKDTINLNISSYIWHPDGNKIIYFSRDKFGMHLYDFETKESRLLYFTYSYGQPIEFSPDGRTLLCYMGGYYLMSIEDNKVKKLVNNEVQSLYYCFSRDGKYLLGVGRVTNGKDMIFKYQIEENKYIPITNDFNINENPRFSPDGNTICFSGKLGNNSNSPNRMYLLNLESQEAKIIYKGYDLNLCWDSKTNYIYFLSDRTICRIRPDGSGFEHLLTPSIDFIPCFELF